MAKKKVTINQLARFNKHLARESATPRPRSGIKGRSFPKPPVVEEVVEEVTETEESAE